LVILVGLFLLARRLMGALVTPLPAVQLTLSALALLAWALSVRILAPTRYAAWFTGAALALVAVGCSFPAERAVDWLVWLAVFGTFLASPLPAAFAPRARYSPPTGADRPLQQLTRWRTADGRDVLQGTLLAEFAAGERTTTLYVTFCPPFERLPRIDLESSVDAKAVQSFHHGAQLEVRLTQPARTACTATVELFATDAREL
jgi:hypothetical protein